MGWIDKVIRRLVSQPQEDENVRRRLNEIAECVETTKQITHENKISTDEKLERIRALSRLRGENDTKPY